MGLEVLPVLLIDAYSRLFLTPAAEKTKTQGKNSSQKLKEKTQPPGGFSLQLGRFKKKLNFPIKTQRFLRGWDFLWHFY